MYQYSQVSLCLSPPPPPILLLILYKLLLSNAPERTPYSLELWKTISYTEFEANRPRVYYGGFAWGKNENLNLNI